MSDLFVESHTPEGGCEVKVHEDAERAPEGWVELADSLAVALSDVLDHVHVSGSRIGLRHDWQLPPSRINLVAESVVSREGFAGVTKSVMGSFTVSGLRQKGIKETRVDAKDPVEFMD